MRIWVKDSPPQQRGASCSRCLQLVLWKARRYKSFVTLSLVPLLAAGVCSLVYRASYPRVGAGYCLNMAIFCVICG